MSQDMLGPLMRALVTVPVDRLGLVLDLTRKLGGRDGDEWKTQLGLFNKKSSQCWAPKPKAERLKAKVIKLSPPPKLLIDRTKPFDPTIFIGQGWSIWKGPANGNGLTGDEEQDKRSLLITELDASKLTKEGNFLTGLWGNESVITGEQKRSRLILEAIQADAKIAEALYKEEGQKTLRFLHDTLGVTWMEFLGTILRGPSGRRYALYLYRNDRGGWDEWDRSCHWLDDVRSADAPALGLAPACQKCGHIPICRKHVFRCVNCGESWPRS